MKSDAATPKTRGCYVANQLKKPFDKDGVFQGKCLDCMLRKPMKKMRRKVKAESP